ncbi:ATP-binding protein [Formosa agariphila KMM 3901]|uniref:ATP-binding protein n=1 Tax=Formosa agariphila (strain DSM 15362 / KCTC 12365 / LMG 23005 / KMM 3901 / M-2Alg 35-1) TaxID=1347342 RepID=T2KIW5_FORAG|nr:ATP-binding domain-containing protein [Formosa agariphila]CDF78812.1 ATP-binding protein [Formosa agariphila KMM 3901]
MKKTYFNWSTGKDSALALFLLLQDKTYSVDKLVTTINSHFNRVSMHGLRVELLNKQVAAIGLPIQYIELPEHPDMDDYNAIMLSATNQLKAESYSHAAFGDIFLEDLKFYREMQLLEVGLTGVFPIWKQDTKKLIKRFLDLGFKAIVVCADANYFESDFVGTVLTQEVIDDLPEEVDFCGENGEFHTFCFDGPLFKTPIDFEVGEKTYREYPAPNKQSKPSGFWYCDLVAV